MQAGREGLLQSHLKRRIMEREALYQSSAIERLLRSGSDEREEGIKAEYQEGKNYRRPAYSDTVYSDTPLTVTLLAGSK